jgi:hypothetical protein
MARLSKRALPLLVVVGILCACVAAYSVLSFVNGMMYFRNPYANARPYFEAKYDGFNLSGSSRASFDGLTLTRPRDISDFLVVTPAGEHLPLSDPQFRDKVVVNGATINELAEYRGEDVVWTNGLSFRFEDGTLTTVVATPTGLSTIRNLPGGDWHLAHQGRIVQLPLSAHEMEARFGRFYELTGH